MGYGAVCLDGVERAGSLFRPDVFVWVDSCAVESYLIEWIASIHASQIKM